MIGVGRKAAPAGGGAFGWLALALVLGAAARFWNLTTASLHTDEAFTFAVSSQPVPSLIHNIAVQDFHPPLFYLATHYLTQWLRWPLWDYRYLTAAFGLLTIAATWGAARRMFGTTAAAVAAIAVAMQPALVQHDRIYRMYAITVALCTLSWWLLVEAERAFGRRRLWLWFGYALVAVTLPYLDYLGAVMLACQALFVLTRLRTLSPALGILALASLTFVPWLGALRTQLPLGGIALSRPALDRGLALSLSGAFAHGVPDAWLASPQANLVAAIAVAVLVLAAGWLGRQSALPFWMGALVVQIAASIALGKNLAYFPRYLLIDVPSISIALGLVISTLAASRARLLALGIALAGLCFFSITVANVLFNPYYQFPDWYAVNALLLRNEQPDDAIVLDAGYELLVVHNYTAFRRHDTLSFMNPNDFKPVLTWIVQHPKRRIWYIEHQNFYWDPSRRIEAALAARRPRLRMTSWVHQSPVDSVSVELFDKAPMTKVR